MAINGVGSINLITPSSYQVDVAGDKKENSVNFGDYLKDALNKVSDLQIDSEKLNDDFAAGKTDSIHEVMIASSKADISLQFTMQIRNKILDAYTEIMRMQI